MVLIRFASTSSTIFPYPQGKKGAAPWAKYFPSTDSQTAVFLGATHFDTISSRRTWARAVMRERLAKLQDALEALKKASVFKKALLAEAALLVALELFEEIIEEIDKPTESRSGAGRQT